MLKRLLVVLLLLPALAFAETFVVGKDFEVITGVNEPASTDKILVTEFFSYGCPWCYSIEPALSEWVKQHDKMVEFKRIPVVFNKEWIYYAKAFYAADLLGDNAKFTPLLFKAIQTDKRQLNSNQAMIDFFIAEGIDKDTAESAFTNSTTVDMNVNEGNVIMGQMRINAVPAVVINNRYKTDLQMAQGQERFFKVLDYLLTEPKSKAPSENSSVTK
jgi:protein dithiol oxidoreductase (disulfide-forming)